MKQRKRLGSLGLVMLFLPCMLRGQNLPNDQQVTFVLPSHQVSVQALGASSLEMPLETDPSAPSVRWNLTESPPPVVPSLSLTFDHAASNLCFSVLSHGVLFMSEDKTTPPLQIYGLSPSGSRVLPTFLFNEGRHTEKDLLYYDQLDDESVGVFFAEPVQSVQLSVAATHSNGHLHSLEIGDFQFLPVPKAPALAKPKCEGWNVLFVNDFSGSITTADREVFVKNLKWLLFTSGTTIRNAGFIGFQTQAQLDLPMQDVRQNRAKIETYLTHLYETNAQEGDLTNWTDALQLAESQLNTQKVDLIVLMTDGLPNVVQGRKSSISNSLNGFLPVLARIQQQKVPIEVVFSDAARFAGSRPVVQWLTGQTLTDQSDKSSLIDSWKALTQGCKPATDEDVHADIFPNPTQSQLTVSLSSSLKTDVKATVSILNLQGAAMTTPVVETHGTYSFDVSGLANGVYLVTVQWENGNKTTQKVMIAH
ncbi:MAG: Secretion system C-terminal sorting domain [Bacteroidota bacterium]|jgi:hypothetical protein